MILPNGSMISKGNYRFMILKNNYWQLVFRHNIPNSPYFTKKEDALIVSYDEDRYSILSKMKSLRKVGFNYEFLLYYPENSSYNHWIQANNPLDEQEENLQNGKSVDGYIPIEISWDYNEWGGLVKSTHPNFLIDGSTYHEHGCYGIGAIRSGVGCKLGPASSNGDVSLWLRVMPWNIETCLKKKTLSCNLLAYILLVVS